MSEILGFLEPAEFMTHYSKITNGRPSKYAKGRSEKPIGGDLFFFAAQRVYCSLTAKLMTDKGLTFDSVYKETEYILANEQFSKFNLKTSGPIYTQGNKLIEENSSGLKWLIEEHCHYDGKELPIDSLPKAAYVGKIAPDYKFKSEDDYVGTEAFKLRIIDRANLAPAIKVNQPGWGVQVDIHEYRSEMVLVPVYLTKAVGVPPTWSGAWKADSVRETSTGEWEKEGLLDKGLKSLKGIKDFE